jgi:hypothetical protein
MPKQSIRQDANPREDQPDTEASVAKLAYQLWLQRGSPEGSPDEDWYRAESLLQSGTAVSAAAAYLQSD